MKLSWLNTSEAHKHTSMYMIWQYESMHKVKRELEIMDQIQTQVIYFEARATALRPRLHTEGFSQNRPHRTSHTGNLY